MGELTMSHSATVLPAPYASTPSSNAAAHDEERLAPIEM